MFAIVRSGNQQFKVQVGDFIRVSSLAEEKIKNKVSLSVLALGEEEALSFTPADLKGASVTASVSRQGRLKKILVFKKKRRKGYRNTTGHRQGFTELEILEIKLPSGKTISKKETKTKEAKATGLKKSSKKTPSLKKTKTKEPSKTQKRRS